MSAALRLHQIGLGFGGRVVFDGLSLVLPHGQAVGVLGPSGSGKTSLLRIACGLQAPTRGRVERAAGRIGFAFQEPRLLSWRSVLDNVLLPAGARPAPGVRERGRMLLDAVGLVGEENRYPDELSGGMRQRVALVRSLLIPPMLLLVDEPLGALHRSARREIATTARRLAGGAAVLWVTHDPDEAAEVADAVVELDPARPDGLHWVSEAAPAPAAPLPERSDER